MRQIIFNLALGLGLSTALPLIGQPFFRTDLQVTADMSQFLYSGRVITAEVNGDYFPDLIVSSVGGFCVLINDNGGGWNRPISNEFASPAPLVPADFNGDGKMDLAGMGCCAPTGRILLGRGDGTFLPPLQLDASWNAAAAGDLNNDGRADLVTSNLDRCGGVHPQQPCWTATVRLSNGDGTFRVGDRIASYHPTVVIADFNRDGRADLAFLVAQSVSVMLGRGDGTFAASVETPLRAERLLAADINGDRLPDLVTESDVLLGRGDGGFGPARQYFYPGEEPFPYNRRAPFAAADFNGDGRTDLATGPATFAPITNYFSIFHGRGDGTFLEAVEQVVGWQPYDATVGDFDRDGRDDIATANGYSSTVSILFQIPRQYSPLDQAVSAANGATVVAPGSLAVLYTETYGTTEQARSTPLPEYLGDLSLVVKDSRGVSRQAQLLYVSDKQINFLVPQGVAPGNAGLAIVTHVEFRTVGTVEVADIAPGLFMMSQPDRIAAATSTRINRDGTRTTEPVFGCSPANSCTHRIIAGPDVTLYGTGLRNVTAADMTCSIEGYPCSVTYAGPQGSPGLDQINIRLPLDTTDLMDRRYGDVQLSVRGILLNTPALIFW